MFTRRFISILIVLILLAVAGTIWAPLLVVAKAGTVLLAVATAIDAVATVYAAYRLKASRTFSRLMSMRQHNNVQLSVGTKMNENAVRRFKVVVYDTVPEGFRVIEQPEFDRLGTFVYNVVPTGRGRHEFGAIRCFVRSAAGLFEARRFFNEHSVAHVYPTFHHLDKIEMLATTRDARSGQQKIRRAGNNTEFEQIRQYVPGDDVRTINWKATARAATLMVNTYTDERSRPIVSVVCAGPAMLTGPDGTTLLDAAASAAVALADSVVRHYDEAGVINLSHRGVENYLLPERSNGTVARILDMTYDFGLPPTPAERDLISDPDVLPDDYEQDEFYRLLDRMDVTKADPDYNELASFALKRLRRRSLIVLFANFENIAVAERALPALNRILQRHNLLVVLFRNKDIEEVAAGKAPDLSDHKLSDMRLRTMCRNYIDRQDMLAAKMRSMGINVLLTRPDRLTADVLQTYLEMKNRATF